MSTRLVLITRRDAHWLGMAPAVAGGWVLVGDDWCNASCAIDEVIGRFEGNLAALPDSIRPLAYERPVDASKLAARLRADADRVEKSPAKCLHQYVGKIRKFAERVEACA